MLLNILNKNDGNISCDFSEQYCEQKLKFQKKKKKSKQINAFIKLLFVETKSQDSLKIKSYIKQFSKVLITLEMISLK